MWPTKSPPAAAPATAAAPWRSSCRRLLNFAESHPTTRLSALTMEGAWESTNAEKLRVLSTSKKVSWEAFQAFLSSAYISSADNSVSQLLCPLQSRVRTSDRTPCSARVRQVEGRRPRRQGHDTHAQRTHHRLLPRESAIAKAFRCRRYCPRSPPHRPPRTSTMCRSASCFPLSSPPRPAPSILSSPQVRHLHSPHA